MPDTPKRIQLRRVEGWRKPEGAIVVARPTKWGNPFDIRRYGLEAAISLFANTARGIWNPSEVPAGKSVGIAYRSHYEWLRRIGGHPLELAICELRGHDLACWCPLDQPCHADVLLKLANAPVPDQPTKGNP